MDIYPAAEQLKAWSQNLGHEEVMTTLRNYGEVSATRQSEIMRELSDNPRETGAKPKSADT
jgi:hypothetical protein